MKISIDCQSPLLQKSLELFLEPYLSSYRQSDLLISDKKIVDESKKVLFISSEPDADLIKPFSKSQLIMCIDNLIDKKDSLIEMSSMINEMDKEESFYDKNRDFSILQRRIEMLTHEYQHNILKAVKAFYEN
jgi:hypothetical protein